MQLAKANESKAEKLAEPFFTANLTHQYQLQVFSINKCSSLAVKVFYNNEEIGVANIITDQADVCWITQLNLQQKHADQKSLNDQPLAKVFIKFLLKLPGSMRKLEFRVASNIDPHLKNYVLTLFNSKDPEQNGNPDEVLVAQKIIVPDKFNSYASKNTELTVAELNSAEQQLNSAEKQEILMLLRQNAYWQNELSAERLNLLLKNSICFVARKNQAIIGFVRILTDGIYASGWDLVVKESERHQGVCIQLLRAIQSSPVCKAIKTWLLFNGSNETRPFYAELGFESIKNSDFGTLCKLRLQNGQPHYMLHNTRLDLSQWPAKLDAPQTAEYLGTKRALFSAFFKKVSVGKLQTENSNESVMELGRI